MPNIVVPEVVGSPQAEAQAKLTNAGLTVGTVTSRTNPSAMGTVISATPATGTSVESGSPVNLEISSGPAQVKVPDVVGLTQPAAAADLTRAGLVVGAVRTKRSDSVPTGGVDSTNPTAGTFVDRGSAVQLDLSTGPGADWKQYIPTILFGALGVLVLVLIGYIVIWGSLFLTQLSNKEIARGLITFLIAISTVGIAIILAISTLVLTEGVEGDKRFDRGKQVLSVLIGVLGTIVGFYFGSDQNRAQTEAPKIITTTLPEGVVGQAYPTTTLSTTSFALPLKWSVAPALPTGLALEPAKGTISGTPTEPSPRRKYTFTVKDSAAQPASATADLELEIKQAPKITTTKLPDGAVHQAYTSTTLEYAGLASPVQWSVTPALPTGLALEPAKGTISGTPTEPSPRRKYTFTVKDSAAQPASATADLELEIK